MKTVTLGELLPTAALGAILDLANSGRARKPAIAAVLEPYRAELEAKGVDLDYFAYLMEFMIERELDTQNVRKGMCPFCGINRLLPDSYACQMCLDDLAAAKVGG